MPRKNILTALIFAAVFGLGVFAFSAEASAANTFYVSPSGSGTTCSDILPCALNYGVNTKASAGDTVIAKAGTYNQKINVTKSGTVGNPIIIQGTLDANGNRLSIIDPYSAVSGWVDASSEFGGQPVWKNTSIGYEVGGLYIVESGVPYKVTKLCQPYMDSTYCSGWRFLLATDKDKIETDEYQGYRPIKWWDGIEALFTSTEGGGTTYIRFRNGDNPNSKTIKAAPLDGTINLKGQSYISVKNFEIRASEFGVNIQNYGDDSTHIELNNNKIILGHRKVRAFGHNISIINNEMTAQSYAEHIGGKAPGAWDCNHTIGKCTDETAIKRHLYIFYKYPCGYSDGGREEGGIHLMGNTSEISGNHIYKMDDLIGSNANYFSIHDNNLHDASSLCIYSAGTHSKTSSIYNNIVYNCNTNFRFGSWQGAGNPAYNYAAIKIYGNKSWQPRDVGNHTFFHFDVGGGVQNHKGEVWFYHNSFSGGRSASDIGYLILTWGSVGMKNVYYINNIMSARSFENDWQVRGISNLIGECAYNWIVGTDRPAWCGNSTNFDNGTSLMWDTTELHEFNVPNSNAINAGIDISKPFTINGTTYPALPGFTVGYGGTDGIPDMGAVQSGDANPADIDGSGSVNTKDIQACVRVITNSETDQNIINNCKNLVSDTPVNVANIKDVQKIVQAIIAP